MILCDVEPHTEAWRKLRLGVITASCADRLLTSTGKVRTGEMPKTFRRELITEKLLGAEIVGRGAGNSYWVDRGIELEDQALEWLSFQTGLAGKPIGFIFRDESRRVGCTPDWMMSDGCPAEVKCPAPWTAVGYALDGALPPDYAPQIHFQLWVTGAPHAWFAAFHPELRGLCVQVPRDDAWIAAIETAVSECIKLMDKELAELER